MKNLEKVNEDPRFREFMTKEEDERKIRNTELYAAEEKGLLQGKIEIAKNLLGELSIEKISEVTGLEIEEIKKLES